MFSKNFATDGKRGRLVWLAAETKLLSHAIGYTNPSVETSLVAASDSSRILFALISV